LKVGGASSGRSHGERVKREPITGIWGQSPQRGPGAEPLVEGQGAKPPEAESFLVLERPTERQNSNMSKSIRLSLTSQCKRLKLFFGGGEQELWPALPCQKLGEQLLHLLPLFQRPCLGVYVGDASVRVFLFHGATDENVRNLYSRISGVFRIWQRGSHGERAERKPITGVWGGAPSGVQGQSPWSGSQGAKPPEAETPFAFKRSMEAANLPIFSEI